MSEHEARAAMAHDSLPQAAHQALKSYPGGLQAFAAAHGYNANTLQQKALPTITHTHINVVELEDILRSPVRAIVLDAIGRITHTAWIDLGDFDAAGDLDVLNTINNLVQSVGRLIAELHRSLEDGEVDPGELMRLQNLVSQLVAYAGATIELAKKYMREDE